MDYNYLLMFFALSMFNVIFSTIRSITTIKSGKVLASLISGGYFSFYNIMLVVTVADFPMWQKCLVTFVCNVVGVWVVKWGEEKARKDRLWKIEATLKNEGISPEDDDCVLALRQAGIPMNYIDINKYLIINCYCATQAESATAKKILDSFNAKYFVSESKTLT